MKKWIIYSVLGVIIICSGLYMFYAAIQQDRWEEEQAAIVKARNESSLQAVKKVDKFVGQKTYMVIYGTNADDEDIIVWVGEENEVHESLASSGANENELKSLMMSRYDEPNILRMTPGKLDQVWVWEVFYTLEKDGEARYYYDFYRFSNGEYLRTYRLSRN